MKLSVPLINGQLADRYGKHASGSDVKMAIPLRVFLLRLRMPLPKLSVLHFGSLTTMLYRLAAYHGFIGM